MLMHDGVDTDLLEKEVAVCKVSNDLSLTHSGESVTFFKRNFELYRGCHRLMRVLPKLANMRPNAHIVLFFESRVS